MLARNKNPIEIGLPQSGILSDDRTVSNYDLLPPETLAAEGWLPCEESKPPFDEATQYLVVDTTEALPDKIIVTYRAVDIPADELSELEDLLLSEMGL